MDCKKIRENMLKEAKRLASDKRINLAIIQVGEDAASDIYVRNKIKTCTEVGINTQVHKLVNYSYEGVSRLISKMNSNPNIHGIILQLPLADDLKGYEQKLLDLIKWNKDVDGLSSENIKRLWTDQECITPATPTGLLNLLPEDLSGKTVTVVNRSNLIGKPLIKMLLNRNATVTIAHSKTNFDEHAISSDYCIVAVGQMYEFDTINHFCDFWIDCGINKDTEGVIRGDVLNGETDVYCTPVPGGVGILTTAQVAWNTIKCYELQ